MSFLERIALGHLDAVRYLCLKREATGEDLALLRYHRGAYEVLMKLAGTRKVAA